MSTAASQEESNFRRARGYSKSSHHATRGDSQSKPLRKQTSASFNHFQGLGQIGGNLNPLLQALGPQSTLSGGLLPLQSTISWNGAPAAGYYTYNLDTALQPRRMSCPYVASNAKQPMMTSWGPLYTPDIGALSMEALEMPRRNSLPIQSPQLVGQGVLQPTNSLVGNMYGSQTPPMSTLNALALAEVAQQAAVQASGKHSQGSPSSPLSLPSSPKLPTLTPETEEMLNKGSPIPVAVPSLFAAPSFEETMGNSTQHPGNTRNVYIRGLPPDTDDKGLVGICERFGEIESSKAIIDSVSGDCKGFGFACFREECAAQACIAALLHCGYQVSFAKESFSTRLKSLQDPSSTNLYLSNLPFEYTEKDVETLFSPYQVQSCRILKDSTGASRGVGFARMSDRNAAVAVIEQFDNHVFSQTEESVPLQVRFADSPHQKRLKGQTQKRRQWRAREYDLLTGRLDTEEELNLAVGTCQNGLLYLEPMAYPYQTMEFTNNSVNATTGGYQQKTGSSVPRAFADPAYVFGAPKVPIHDEVDKAVILDQKVGK